MTPKRPQNGTQNRSKWIQKGIKKTLKMGHGRRAGQKMGQGELRVRVHLQTWAASLEDLLWGRHAGPEVSCSHKHPNEWRRENAVARAVHFVRSAPCNWIPARPWMTARMISSTLYRPAATPARERGCCATTKQQCAWTSAATLFVVLRLSKWCKINLKYHYR